MPWKSTAYEGTCPYCSQEFSYVEYHIRDRCEATPVVAARVIAPDLFNRKRNQKQTVELRIAVIAEVQELLKRVRP